MSLRTLAVVVPRASLLAVLLVSSIGVLAFPAVSAQPTSEACGPTLLGSTFVAAPPAGATGPDDITVMSKHGVDGGRGMIWTAYQDGINPTGRQAVPEARFRAPWQATTSRPVPLSRP